jgi:hypothetical protein
MPVQRCTVHKHRNLLAHAPDRLHEEVSADYNDMIYADSKPQIEAKRKAFIRKWRLKCRVVADSLEEAGDKLFTFTRFPKSQWKSIRTSNAIERLHEETVLPAAETAAMLFWALLASGQITMRKVDGWQSLQRKAKSAFGSAHLGSARPRAASRPARIVEGQALRRKIRQCCRLSIPRARDVLSLDEKSQIQALDRTQSGLPMKKAAPAR